LKVCILGSSNVGALAMGWRKIAAHYDAATEVQFFSAPGGLALRLKLEGKEFGLHDEAGFEPADVEKVRATNGRLTIDLGSADHVIYVGLGNVYKDIVETLNFHGVEGISEREAMTTLPQETYMACCGEIVRVMTPGEGWCGWATPSLTYYPGPRVAEDCVDTETFPNIYDFWRELARAPEGVADTLGMYEEAFRRDVAAKEIRYLAQPSETIGPGGLTRQQWTARSVRLRNGKVEDGGDHAHMNGDYGSLVLESYLEAIRIARTTKGLHNG
jgi:hypothetical protein